MKKGFIFLVCALFLLTACGKNEVVCTGKVEEDGYTVCSNCQDRMNDNNGE